MSEKQVFAANCYCSMRRHITCAAHPREKYLLPLMVAAGAGGIDRRRHIDGNNEPGAKFSARQFG
jgi:hypothetical protein